MFNVYELLFGILILIFYYLFVWEMRHLHTGGSCPVVSGQVCDYDQLWSLAGRVAQCCRSYAQFVVFYVTLNKNPLFCAAYVIIKLYNTTLQRCIIIIICIYYIIILLYYYIIYILL